MKNKFSKIDKILFITHTCVSIFTTFFAPALALILLGVIIKNFWIPFIAFVFIYGLEAYKHLRMTKKYGRKLDPKMPTYKEDKSTSQ